VAWQTSGCGCGTGIGCDHRPIPLCIIQGAPLSMVLTASDPVAGRTVMAEVRSNPLGRLLLDMAPYCSTTADAPLDLVIEVPGEATRGVDSSGVYDVWVDDEMLAHGPATLQLAVSKPPGTRISAQSWTPVLMAGQPYAVVIATAGMMPPRESISVAQPPELVVSSPSGEPLVAVAGPPRTFHGPADGDISIVLPPGDTAALGPGRFTYSLTVANQFLERRMLLAGMLFVEEVPS
jgi:hypothetical protein